MFKPFLTKWPFLFKFRLFLAGILLFLILLALYFKIVPLGHISYSHSWPSGWRSGKGFIYDLKPAERMSIDEAGVLKVLADPIYFSLFTPRTFDRAKVTIKYFDRLSSDTPIIELGVLRDKVSGRYDLKPLENRIIDSLVGWTRLENEDSGFILSSSRNYAGPKEFWSDFRSGQLKDCPEGMDSCLAAFNYNLNPADSPILNFLGDYKINPIIISQPWRGAHDFYVYLTSGLQKFDFSFVDLNQDKAPAPISLRLYSGSNLIAESHSPDESGLSGSGQTEEKFLSLSSPVLSSGLYKVSIGISDDMVISKIISPSDKLSFINKIWPVSSPKSLTIFTDIDNLQVKTFNPASLGGLNFGGRSFNLDRAYQMFNFSAAPGIKSINLEKDDVVLEGRGVFTLSRESVINPNFKEVDRYFRPSNGVKYILADYKSPRWEAGTKIATAEFDLKSAARTDGRYTFLLSIPGLAGEGSNSYLEIKEIKVELSGRNIWQKLKSFFLD